MRMWVFTRRNIKEMLRDPITVCFGLGFPVVLMVLLSAINNSIPAQANMQLFEPQFLTPGTAVFGLSFLSLFAGMLISKDRCSSFLTRLFTTPLTSSDYILGYILPLVPLAVIQAAVCYGLALILGLKFTVNIFLALAMIIPTAVIYIAIGLICGSVLNDKQVGGMCGALLTNLTAWLSGTWFSLDLVGGAFEKIAYVLPFAHAVDMGRAALNGDYENIFPHLWWVLGYAVVLMVLSVVIFKKKMKRD